MITCYTCNTPVVLDEPQYGFPYTAVHLGDEYIFCSEYCKTQWEHYPEEWSEMNMFKVGDKVQIINHAEPHCNGQFGEIMNVQLAYDQTPYYVVHLDDSYTVCTCTDDEIMEG